MILRALYDYYNRCKNNLPPYGRELKEIGFLLVIDREGRFMRFEDRRLNAKQAQKFLVKKHVDRSSNIAANYLYDSAAYVFGYSDKGESAEKYFKAFKEKVLSIYERFPDDYTLSALQKFYSNPQSVILSALQQDVLWGDIQKNLNKKYSTFSFIIEGDTEIIAEKEQLLNLLDKASEGEEKICLISGEKGIPATITTPTMIAGSQATAKLVSFQERSGYDSYGKKKGENATISEHSEFAYTTALNHLLASDSRNKFIIGNRTYLFWASTDSEAAQNAEESLFAMLGFNNGEDDANRNIENVRKVFAAIYSGTLHTSGSDKFYILGLAPNSARIAVVYWAEIKLQDFARKIIAHLDDMEIIGKAQKPYCGLRSILAAITLDGKVSETTPNLPDAVVKSIFQGVPYPYTLFAECIHRIRAESGKGSPSITTPRAAIIKAYLNRARNNNQKKINIMLDKENNNQAYLCGRLFAVLDKIQEEANNIHSIRERYMNAASATPSGVFATILNLSNHHIENLTEGRKISFEKLKQEIFEKISPEGFPAHLDLMDQGRFFVGYYHQREDLFKSKKENNE